MRRRRAKTRDVIDEASGEPAAAVVENTPVSASESSPEPAVPASPPAPESEAPADPDVAVVAMEPFDLVIDPAAPPLPAPVLAPMEPEGELEVVFAKGLGGRAIRLRERPEEGWAALIAASSWVGPNDPSGSAAGSAPDAGINPYRATTKARRISNRDITGLCALPSLAARDEPMNRVAVAAAPPPAAVRMPGPTRSEVMATLIPTGVPAGNPVVREAAVEASEAAAAFDRWAEGEGAWRHDPVAAEPEPAEEIYPAAVVVAAPPASEPSPSVDMPLVVEAAEPPPVTEAAKPIPAAASALMRDAPAPAAEPPHPAPGPSVLPPLPAGTRQVRTLLFDTGPLFSRHPLLVTVIIEPLPRPGESPPAQPAEPVSPMVAAEPAPPVVGAEPASPTAAATSASVVSPRGARGAPARSRTRPVSLLGGILGLGASLGSSVVGALGFGGRARAVSSQKKSPPEPGDGGKVRPPGVQEGKPRR